MTLAHCVAPCRECPWRRDISPGKFTPDRFRALAHTAYDASWHIFACHMSKDEAPVACAGFLLRGARHNLTVRIAAGRGFDWGAVTSGAELYATYREMAVANGVPADDQALERCRDD